MKKKVKKQKALDDLRPEYDFSALKNGVRGKYGARFLSKRPRRRTH
jgi:hypothetical protein